MKEIEYIDDWRKIKNAEIIDVRSPSEFNNDHIPGSINIPILNQPSLPIVDIISLTHRASILLHMALAIS